MGFVHLEFFYDLEARDLVISEFGYRLGGGRIIRNHEEAFGMKYSDIFISMVQNLSQTSKVIIKYSKYKFVGDMFLPIQKDGRVISFMDINLLGYKGIREIKYFYNSGDLIKKEKNSHSAFGQVVIDGESMESILSVMDSINKKFYLEVGNNEVR